MYIFRYLVELALMNAEFLNWRASMVAAAAVALSRYSCILYMLFEVAHAQQLILVRLLLVSPLDKKLE